MSVLSIVERHDVLQIPGAYDALSARLISQAGYPLVYFSGLGNEASDLGVPDLGLTTASELVGRASNIVQGLDVPLICDADTGFGGHVNVARTVRQFEAAGVGAIHLEDQSFPKRCGVLEGKQVIAAESFAEVIETALAARRGDGLCIIARSDAKAAEGVEGVIERLRLYVEAGAQMAMLGDFYTLDEYARIAAALSVPLIAVAADRDHADRQPDFTRAQWREAGVRLVLYWHLPLFAALAAVREAVEALRHDGSTEAVPWVAGYDDYAEVTDLEDWLRLGDGPSSD